MPSALLRNTRYSPILARGITEETCKHLGYQVGETTEGPCHVATYYGPEGPVAQHLRYEDKEMPWKGEPKQAYLFGQQAFKAGGKRLIITEGELDALSVDQCLGHKWPVCAVPGTGMAAAFVARNLTFIDSFEDVVLWFDMDDPGREAARKCAELLPPGKASIVRTFAYKDANEALQAGAFEAITKAQWNAEDFWPDDLIESGSDEMFSRLLEFKIASDYPYPWPQLDGLLRGMRRGEMTLWVAGTGVGKSQTLKDITLHILADVHKHGKKVGLVMLEESIEVTHIILASMHMGTDPLDWDSLPVDQRRAAYDAVFGDGRFILYDHWGSLDSGRLFTKIRGMVAAGCDVVMLDHISIVISGSDEADGGGERRVIDKVMTKLETLVKEMQFSLHAVCHLRKGAGGGDTHETGAQVMLDDVRGSGTLKTIPDNIVALERDTQAADEKAKTTAQIRVLKNRLARRTGLADTVRFDLTTGRYSVVDDAVEAFAAAEQENQCDPTKSDF